MKQYSFLLKQIVAVILIIFMPLRVLCADIEVTSTALSGSSLQNSSTINFNPIATANLIGTPTINSIRNIITFEIVLKGSANVYFADKNFDATCALNITGTLLNGTTTSFTIPALTVDFKKIEGAAYKAIATYEFKDYKDVNITVTSFTPNGDINSSNIIDYPIFKLSSSAIIDYTYSFSTTTTGNITSYLYPPTENKIDIFWKASNFTGAESYDLEWTYLDINSQYGIQINAVKANSSQATALLTTAFLDKVFKNNSSRVNIPYQINFEKTFANGTISNLPGYTFNLNYNEGFILYRVRGVQELNGVRLESDWNYNGNYQTGSSYNNPNFSKAIVAIAWHQQKLNWQYNATYAEDGKRKEVINYFDGSLRSRQTVTINNADNKAVIAEPMYDALGRQAMNILPAPTNDDKLNYHPRFNLNASLKPLSYLDITTNPNNCSIAASALSATSGVEQYYSANNPFLSNSSETWHKAIPNSEGYPYSITQYTPDNTGRIKAQGGVGKDFQLNGLNNHGTTYFYGKPGSQDELDRLFGAEAGDFNHYLKNVVKDANGQLSVSYVNSSGKTVATCLAEAAPDNLAALNSQVGASQTINSILLSPTSFTTNAANSSLESTTQFTVTSIGNNNFSYSFTPTKYTYTQTSVTTNPNLCYTCVYDLYIIIKDECGTIITSINQPKINTQNFDCTKPDQTFTGNFDAHFINIGDYTVYFELKINKASMDFYTETYIKENRDLKTFNSFFIDNVDDAALDECIASCDDCVEFFKKFPDEKAFIKYVENLFIEKQKTEITNNQNYKLQNWDYNREGVFYTNLYKTIISNCASINAGNTSVPASCATPCDDILQVLEEDVTPGGQYALYDANYNLLEPEINVLRYYDNKISGVKIVYKDDDGSLSKIKNEVGEYVTPDKLTPKEFITNFQDSWVSEFVKFHPEYCQYEWCVANSDSKKFDDDVESLEDPNVAIANDWFSKTDRAKLNATANSNLKLFNHDPFFQGAYATTTFVIDPITVTSITIKEAMERDIMNYTERVLQMKYPNSTTNPSPIIGNPQTLLQTIDYELYCDEKDPNNWGITCAISEEDGCRSDYKEWKLYSEWYLDRKLKYYQEALYQNKPDCYSCYIPSGAGDFDPVSGTGVFDCIAPPANDFTIELMPNSKADGFMRIKLLYKGGNGASKWPLNVIIRQINTTNNTVTDLPVVFRPATGEQEILVQDNFTVFQIISVSCAQATLTGGAADLSRKSKIKPSTIKTIVTNNSTNIQQKTKTLAKQASIKHKVNEEVTLNNECQFFEGDFNFNANYIGLVTPGDQNSDEKWQIEVCYTGTQIILDDKKVDVTISYNDCSNSTGTLMSMSPFSFCKNSATCQQQIVVIKKGCSEFENSIQISKVECSNSKCNNNNSINDCPYTTNDFSAILTYVGDVDKNNQQSDKLWKIQTCYTNSATPLPNNYKVKVTVQNYECNHSNSSSTKTLDKNGEGLIDFEFCSSTGNCLDYYFTTPYYCHEPIIEAPYIKSVECTSEPCNSDWQCPTSPDNYLISVTKGSGGKTGLNSSIIKVCYVGGTIPNGRKIKATINVPCSSNELGSESSISQFPIEFCGNTYCQSIMPEVTGDNLNCIMRPEQASIENIDCVDEDCNYATWNCDNLSEKDFTVIKTKLPNGDLQLKVCYIGNVPIPDKKIVNVTCSLFVGYCETKATGNYDFELCNTTACKTIIIPAASICIKSDEQIQFSYLSAKCFDGNCKWECPTNASYYQVVLTPLVRGTKITVCYNGPTIPEGKIIKVDLVAHIHQPSCPFTGIPDNGNFSVIFTANSPNCYSFNVIPEACKRDGFALEQVLIKEITCTNEIEFECTNFDIANINKYFSITPHISYSGTSSIDVCYIGPKIKNYNRISFDLEVNTGCGKEVFKYCIDRHSPKCRKYNFKCTSEPTWDFTNIECSREHDRCIWDCNEFKKKYNLSVVKTFNQLIQLWQLTITYTGPALPQGTLLTVPVYINPNSCNISNTSFTAKFCSSVNSITFTLNNSKECGINDFDYEFDEIACKNNASCGNENNCPEPSDFNIRYVIGGVCNTQPLHPNYSCALVEYNLKPSSSVIPISPTIKGIKLLVEFYGTDYKGLPFTETKYILYSVPMGSLTQTMLFEYTTLTSRINGTINVRILNTECLTNLPGSDCNPRDDVKSLLYLNN